jgi:hypothetical protein
VLVNIVLDLGCDHKLLKDEIAIDELVKVPDQKRGIIDLMLSQLVKSQRVDEIEHLIVELQRPSCVIGKKEIGPY